MSIFDAIRRLRNDKSDAPQKESPELKAGDQLKAGDRHYRAWVGPPNDYDLMAANQVGLLFAAGLRDTDKLADVGCGSLRAGRLLIPYLQPGRYFGIEPDRDMLEKGIESELGRDILKIKTPSFLHGTDFPLHEFGERFDYVLAQSIWSHTYPGLMHYGFERIASSLAPGGKMIATYKEGGNRDKSGSGWLYPGVVPYRWEHVERILNDAGLAGKPLDWPHPRQRWFVAARHDDKAEIELLANNIRSPQRG